MTPTPDACIVNLPAPHTMEAMEDPIKPLLLALQRLRVLVRQDEQLRTHVADLAAALTALTTVEPNPATPTPVVSPNHVAPADVSAPVESHASEPSRLPNPAPVPDRLAPAEALTKIKIGAQAPRPIADYSEHSVDPLDSAAGALPFVPSTELTKASARCRQKDAQIRKQLKSLSIRSSIPSSGAPALAIVPALRDPNPSATPDTWEALAGSYVAAADAIDLALTAIDRNNPAAVFDTFQLLAEAHNALRHANSAASADDSQDDDQLLIHKFLKRETKIRGVLIAQYMRRNDRADPANHPDLRRRLSQTSKDHGFARAASDPATQAINKLKYKLEKPTAPGDFSAALLWLAEQLDKKVLPPSDPELSKVLAPYLDKIHAHQISDGKVADAFKYAADKAARTSKPTERAPQSTQHSLSEVVNALASELHDKIVLCLNKSSTLERSLFEDTDSAAQALRFLATTYHDAKSGVKPCPRLQDACKEQSGFDFAPHQSETTIGKFENEYHTTLNGEKIRLEAHLGSGITKDPRHTLRIAFHWHEELGKVVIGYIGQHQRNGKT